MGIFPSLEENMYGYPCRRHSCTEKKSPLRRVLRIGADFKLRCTGCGREVMGARTKYEKQIKKIERAEPPENDGKSGN